METTPPSQRRWQEGIPLAIQRSIAFLGGFGMIVREMIVENPVRWQVFVVCMGMMGGSFTLKTDAVRRAVMREEDQ